MAKAHSEFQPYPEFIRLQTVPLLLYASAALHLTKLSSFVIVFMQNKANFRKSQMNVTPLVIIDYEKISDWTLGENKPKTKPNKANLPEGKIDTMCVFTKDYEEKRG